jgi:hypothetical protein
MRTIAVTFMQTFFEKSLKKDIAPILDKIDINEL